MTVAEQREPDGGFPTVRFPNPEEPGALDLALALARKTDAALILANLPFALVGGLLGILLSDGIVSIASIVGHFSY